MGKTELWLTYQLASRAHLPPTTQLIELACTNEKLADLEDVLEHVFRQGFVEAKHRPKTWWQKMDGERLKGSFSVEDLLKCGVGNCVESALKLIVDDVPTHLWFQYVYPNVPASKAVTQRVKLVGPGHKLERLAHVTNHIFNQGYLAPNLRPFVYWQNPCGKRIQEHVLVDDILACGEGFENYPIKLVVDQKPLKNNAFQPLKNNACQPQINNACQPQINNLKTSVCHCAPSHSVLSVQCGPVQFQRERHHCDC